MTSRVFRSRWSALLWAAGILWTAWDFAGDQPSDPTGNAVAVDAAGAPVSGDEMAALVNRIG